MIYRFGEFEYHSATRELHRNGEIVPVEPQVFSLIGLLIERRDRVVSKDELIESVWEGRFISDTAVSSRVKSARQALGDDGKAQQYIKTVHGAGFRFVATVEEHVPEPADGKETPSAKPDFVFQDIRYCRSNDGTQIAYATAGDGPPLVKCANWLNHLEYDWQSPVWKHVFGDLMRDHALTRYDARGNGLSDWSVSDFSFERQVEDLEAVIGQTGLERFPLLGLSQGCAVSAAFAARHPEKVTKLVLIGGYATGWALDDNEKRVEQGNAMKTLVQSGWGMNNPAFRQIFTALFMPDAPEENQTWFNELQRKTTSGANAVSLMTALGQVDVRRELAQVKAPTLVIHCRGDVLQPIKGGQALAKGIPGARFMTLESKNHLMPETDPAWPVCAAAIQNFLAE